MARTPRASVSKTSGQGVSRLSYQKGRKLGGGTPAVKDSTKVDVNFGGTRGMSGKTKDYDKQADLNVSYGDALFPSDLGNIKEFGSGKIPKSSVSLKPAKPKSWKK